MIGSMVICFVACLTLCRLPDPDVDHQERVPKVPQEGRPLGKGLPVMRRAQVVSPPFLDPRERPTLLARRLRGLRLGYRKIENE